MGIITTKKFWRRRRGILDREISIVSCLQKSRNAQNGDGTLIHCGYFFSLINSKSKGRFPFLSEDLKKRISERESFSS